MTLLTRIGNLKVLLPLLALFFLLAACGKPSTPRNSKERDSLSWEQLPPINLDWIKPEFKTVVTNTSGVATNVDIPFDTVKTNKHIIFRPATGDYHSISYGSGRALNTIGVTFTFSPEIDQSKGTFESHSYFNGQYEYHDPVYTYGNVSYFSHIRTKGTIYTLRPMDTWYFIYVFQGTDGKDYQYRTPIMSVANAL